MTGIMVRPLSTFDYLVAHGREKLLRMPNLSSNQRTFVVYFTFAGLAPPLSDLNPQVDYWQLLLAIQPNFSPAFVVGICGCFSLMMASIWCFADDYLLTYNSYCAAMLIFRSRSQNLLDQPFTDHLALPPTANHLLSFWLHSEAAGNSDGLSQCLVVQILWSKPSGAIQHKDVDVVFR